MTELRLAGDVRIALSHLSMVGLAAIMEDSGASGVCVSWEGKLDARPVVMVPEWTTERIAEAVRSHAERHAAEESWVGRGLMSPRVTRPRDLEAWRTLAAVRQGVLEQLRSAAAVLDLRMIGALGEPAYWTRKDGDPEDGASRLEMQPRNSGATFVKSRLLELAKAVAQRDEQAILDGLTDKQRIDEIGIRTGRWFTATGLASPGPTDNAIAWCALWGISQFPLVHLVASPSRTAGHIEPAGRGGPRHGWWCCPVPERRMSLPRFRTITASAHLVTVASMRHADSGPAEGALLGERARAWLADHGVGAIVRFPIEEFGSGHAAERRMLAGTVEPTRGEGVLP